MNKALVILLLTFSLTYAVVGQQELCRMEFADGQKYVLYADGSFKYAVGSKPINPSGLRAEINDAKCGAKKGEQVWLKPDGTWKHLPNPDLTKIVSKSFDEVTSDRISIVDKPVRVAGTLKETDWYWGLYRDKEATHFAFRLNSPSSSRDITLYFPRGEKANELRARMKANGNKLDGEFDIWFSTLAYEATKNNAGKICAELLDYLVAVPAPTEVSKTPPAETLPTPIPTPRKSGYIYQDMIDDDNHKDWAYVSVFELKGDRGNIYAYLYDTHETDVGLLLKPFAHKWVEVFIRIDKLTSGGGQIYGMGSGDCTDKTVNSAEIGFKYADTKRFVLGDSKLSGPVRVGKKDPDYLVLEWACRKAGFWK